MSATVLTGKKEGKGGKDPPERGDGPASWTGPIWSVLAWIGFALFVVAGVDVILTWVPTNFGNVEWEFGTVTSSFNGLPTVTIGLGLWLGASIFAGRRKTALALSGAFWAIGVLIVAAGILYAPTVPVALDTVPEGAVRGGLQKAIAKSSVQAILYPVVYAVVGWKGFRAARDNRS